MTRRRVVFGVLSAVAVMLSLGACGSRAEVRTKVTIEVATPQGVRSGSSIWSWALGEPTVALASSYDGRFRGEAVAIDLPGGRTLFALVKDMAVLPERHFREFNVGTGSDRVANVRAIAKEVGATRTLACAMLPVNAKGDELFNPKYDCPLLVTFRDIRDPKSVERVDPASLDKSFGAGVTLRRITVAVTDDPVTTGIEKRLGWLARSEDGGLDPTMGVTANPTFVQQLGFLDFRRK